MDATAGTVQNHWADMFFADDPPTTNDIGGPVQELSDEDYEKSLVQRAAEADLVYPDFAW